MPELPEVETIRRDLIKYTLNQEIIDVTIIDCRVIRQSVRIFKKRLKNQKITQIDRRGKALVCHVGAYRFVIQPMMTGIVLYSPKKKPREEVKETKVIIHLRNGDVLHYNDQRLFGRLQVIENEQELTYFRSIGPEPLTDDFTVDWIRKGAINRNIPIKQLLLDHKFIAGIGNIYASEILFEASILPTRPASSLTVKEIKKLHQSTRSILQEAVDARGSSMRNYRDSDGNKGGYLDGVRVYAQDGCSCPRCRNTSIEKEVVAQRSTFYCPQCQT